MKPARVSVKEMSPFRLTRRQALAGGLATVLARGLAGVPVLARPSAPRGVHDVEQAVALHPSRTPLGRGRWHVSDVIAAQRRVDLAGVRWLSPGSPRIELRARRGGHWSGWIELPPPGDHAPDRARAQRTSEPVWVGGAQALEVRASGPVRGLRLRFVSVARAAAPRRFVRRAAGSGAPPIIGRGAWGAEAPRAAPEYGEVQVAFVHHTVTANDYGPQESAAMVRGIQHYHRNVLGWNDIGYNFLVDRHGQVFEGRSGGIEGAVIGAHAQGFNSVSSGVASLGTHTATGAEAAALEAFAALIAWKLSLHGVPTEGEATVVSLGGETSRYPAGQRVQVPRIAGHRHTNETACPGDALFAQLPALRARAGELAAGAGGLSLSASGQRITYGEPLGLSGQLLLGDGTAGGGREVELETRRKRAWRTLARTVTAVDGTWSATVLPEHSGRLRARFRGDQTQAGLKSTATRIEVRSKVIAEVSSARVRVGERVAVRGRIEPAQAVQRVALILERKRRGGYERVDRVNAIARDGRLKARIPIRTAGRHRIRVRALGDTLNAASRAVRLEILARRE